MSSINKKLLILETNTLIQKCLMDSKFGNKSYIYRAKFMAENLVNIQNITRQKIVMSAHNGHIFKDKKAKEMGFFIHEMIGNKYFALGIEFNKGSITGFTMDSVNYYSRVVLVSDSLNSKNLAWYFKDVPFTSSYVNLRDLDNKYISFFNQLWKMSSLKGCYGNKRCNERFWKINPYKSYDGIIFIRDAIPSSLLWEFRPIKGYEYR
jgi:erythromycin esterase-like protein